MMEILSHSVEETEQVGCALAKHILQNDPFPVFVALYGDLGAGKTAFVRGFASILSPGSRVKSPTYTIVNEYRQGKKPLFHFDLYRITSEEDLFGMGFDEYVESGYCIAEWCEHIGDAMPDNAVTVRIDKVDENTRKITISEELSCTF